MSPTLSAITAGYVTLRATTSSSATANHWVLARRRCRFPDHSQHKATRRWLCAQTRLGSERLARLVEVFEAEVGGVDIALCAATVEALALELVGEYAAVLGLFHQRIGDLDFATLARRGIFDDVENIRGEDVTTDDRQVGRRIFRLGLLDHAMHPVDVITDHLAGDHAILVGLLRGHFLNGDDRAAELVIQLDHLGQDAVAFQVQAQVIGQYYGEGFVADQRTSTENCVAEAFHFDLAGVGKAALIDQAADAYQVFFLVGIADLVLQLVADVEVILQRALATHGDHGDLRQPSFKRLFDAILDQWLVHYRQHFLGHGLGCR